MPRSSSETALESTPGSHPRINPWIPPKDQPLDPTQGSTPGSHPRIHPWITPKDPPLDHTQESTQGSHPRIHPRIYTRIQPLDFVLGSTPGSTPGCAPRSHHCIHPYIHPWIPYMDHGICTRIPLTRSPPPCVMVGVLIPPDAEQRSPELHLFPSNHQHDA